MTHHWRTVTGLQVVEGSIVLDDRGLPWVVTDEGGYGNSNVAICHGIGYNTRRGVAVHLESTFKLSHQTNEAACPENRKVGKESYWRMFHKNVEPRMSREMKARHWKGPHAV